MRRAPRFLPQLFRTGLLALLSLTTLPARAEISKEHLARLFRNETPRGWSSLLAADPVAGRVELVETSQLQGDSRAAYEFDYCEGNALLRCRRETATATEEEVVCRNARYAFRLQRAGEGPWQLTHFSRGGSPPEAVTRPLEEARRRWAQPCVRFENRSLPEWLQTPGFQVRGLDFTEFEGHRGLVRVQFTCPAPEGSPGSTADGYWLLEDGAFWSLRYAEIHLPEATGTATHRQLLRFTPVLGERYPLLQEGEWSGRDAQRGTWSQQARYRDFHYDGNTPEYRFTLAAFGLPDPGADATPLRAGPGVLALLGVALVVLVARGVREGWRRHGRA